MRMRLALALGLAVGGLSLSSCADDIYGPYGYGGYYGGYGYGPYDYGYSSYDPFGWYGDFYYPGVGIYVYDSYRRPHHWNGEQEHYWSGRRATWQSRSGRRWNRQNWSGFSRSGTHWRRHN